MPSLTNEIVVQSLLTLSTAPVVFHQGNTSPISTTTSSSSACKLKKIGKKNTIKPRNQSKHSLSEAPKKKMVGNFVYFLL